MNEIQLEDLMRQSQQGDQVAFAKLCEMRRTQLVAEVRRKIDRRLLPRVDASDVIQEVFFDATRRLHEVLGNDTPLIAWLRFLCNQKIVDLQRKHIGAKKRSVQRERNQPDASFDLDSIAQHFIANITSPSMQAHRHDMAVRIRGLLRELAPLDREVLVLRHFHELTNAEVAESLDLSTNAASNRYIRAIKRFKTVLESHHGSVSPGQ